MQRKLSDRSEERARLVSRRVFASIGQSLEIERRSDKDFLTKGNLSLTRNRDRGFEVVTTRISPNVNNEISTNDTDDDDVC